MGLEKEIYEVFKTVNKMLKKRGYVCVNENIDDLIAINYNIFEKKYLTLDNLHLLMDKNGKKLEVYFLEDIKEDSKVGIRSINTCLEKVKENKNNHVIIITKNGITTVAFNTINNYSKDEIKKIEIFEYNQLIVDITENKLVPQHILLTPEERTKFLEKSSIKDTQLSKILVTDPVSKFYGFEKNDIIKIIRISETAGIAIVYKIVS